MKVRRVWHRDIEQIARILKTGYSKMPYNEKWPGKVSLSKVRWHYEHSVVFVAVEEGEVMGFIILDEDKWPDGTRGWLEELIVSEKHQGSGVGNCLMEKAMEYFKKRKFKGAVGVTHPDSKTWGWFRRLGFKSTGLQLIVKDFTKGDEG